MDPHQVSTDADMAAAVAAKLAPEQRQWFMQLASGQLGSSCVVTGTMAAGSSAHHVQPAARCTHPAAWPAASAWEAAKPPQPPPPLLRASDLGHRLGERGGSEASWAAAAAPPWRAPRLLCCAADSQCPWPGARRAGQLRSLAAAAAAAWRASQLTRRHAANNRCAEPKG